MCVLKVFFFYGVFVYWWWDLFFRYRGLWRLFFSMIVYCSVFGGGFWVRFGVEKGVLVESEVGKGNR